MTVQAENGFTSTVNLTCTPRAPTLPAPPTCTVTPSAKTPSIAGAGFTVNAAGPVGDYLFNVHGVGTDANTTTRDFALTLHVVDFNLTAPAPASLTTNQSSVSGPVAFQVTAAGAFNQAVALSCGGLPAGGGLQFPAFEFGISDFGQPCQRDPDHKRRRQHTRGTCRKLPSTARSRADRSGLRPYR